MGCIAYCYVVVLCRAHFLELDGSFKKLYDTEVSGNVMTRVFAIVVYATVTSGCRVMHDLKVCIFNQLFGCGYDFRRIKTSI